VAQLEHGSRGAQGQPGSDLVFQTFLIRGVVRYNYCKNGWVSVTNKNFKRVGQRGMNIYKIAGQGPSLGSGQLMKILLHKQTSKSSCQNIKARFRSKPLLVPGLSLNDPVSQRLSRHRG